MRFGGTRRPGAGLRLAAWLAAAVFAWAMVPAAASAAVVPMSVPELAAQADAVVLVHVTGRQSLRMPDSAVAESRRPIFTDYTLHVTKVLKGMRPAALSLRLPGGEIGNLGLHVSEVPRLAAGETCYLFLDAQDRVIGGYQGRIDAGGPAGDAALEAEIAGTPAPAAKLPSLWDFQAGIITPAAVPAITSMTPDRANAGVGENVTVTGSGFGAVPGTVQFLYQGTKTTTGVVTAWSDTSITVQPPGLDPASGYTAGSGNALVVDSGGQKSAGFAYDVGYSYSGDHWASMPVAYWWNKNTADAVNMGADVTAAQTTWNGSPFRRTYFAMTNLGSHATATAIEPAYDGVNEIYFGTGFPAGVLAWNYFYTVGTQIVDSNIVINDAFTWVDGASSGNYDLTSLLTHEMGHTICLDDQYGPVHGASPGDTTKIMYGYLSSNAVKTTLSTWDAAGELKAYGTDTTAPAAPTVSSTSHPITSIWYPTDPAVFTASASDPSGIAGYSWSVDQASGGVPDTTLDTATSTVSTSPPSDGVWYFHVRAIDAFGNVSSTGSRTFKVDRTPPSASISPALPAVVKQGATFTFSGSDPGAFTGTGAGLARFEWSIDGGMTQTAVPASASFTASTAGTHTITYVSRDGAGNLSATGSGSFRVAVASPLAFPVVRDLPAGFSGPSYPAAGDLNGDGTPDLVVPDAGHGGAADDVAVMLSDGTGGYLMAAHYRAAPLAVSAGTAQVALADMNGDGRLDIVTANTADDSVSVLLNLGAGRFSLFPVVTALPAGSAPAWVATGDFNGDGKTDVLVTDRGTNDVTFLSGDNTGSLFAPNGPVAVGALPTSLATGDFNRDGKRDFAVCSDFGDITIFAGDGAGGFTGSLPIGTGAPRRQIVAADLNGDGNTDLAASSASGTVVVEFLSAAGAPTGSSYLVDPPMAPAGLAVTDMDGDLNPDVVVADSASGAVRIFRGNGAGTFSVTATSTFAAGGPATGLATGLFDGDGTPDIAVTRTGADACTMLLTNADLGTAPGTVWTTTPASPNGSAGWFRGPVAPVLGYSRDATGVTWYAWDDQTAAFTPNAAQTATVLPLPGQGARPLYNYAVNTHGARTTTGTVTVKWDASPPVSSASVATSYALAATITIDATDPVSGVATTYHAVDAGAITTGAVVHVTAPGPHTLLYWSVDTAGNVEGAQAAGFLVVSPPVTTVTVTPASPNGSAGWYSVTTPTVSLSRDVSGTTTWYWDASAPVTSSAAPVAVAPREGVHTLHFWSASVGGTESAQSFLMRLDTAAPVSTSDAQASYIDTATVHISPTEPLPGSGLAGTRWAVDGSPATSGTVATVAGTGSHTLEWSSADIAGNRETTKSATIGVQMRVPPVTTITLDPAVPDGNGGWYVTTPTIQVSRDLAGTTWWWYGSEAPASDAATTFTVPARLGASTLSAYSVSSIGATEIPAVQRTIAVDTVAPHTASDLVTTYTITATVTLTPGDAGGSGIAATRWAVDGGVSTSGTVATASGIGAHTLEWSSIDVAGNREATQVAPFAIALTAPPVTTLTLTPAAPDGGSGWYVHAPDLRAVRTPASGLTWVSVDGGAASSETSSDFLVSVLEGEHTYAAYSVDENGSIETPGPSVSVKLDTTAPSTTSNASALYAYAASVTISLTPTETVPGSGVAGTRWSLDGSPATSGTVAVAGPGPHQLTWSSIDVAGNRESTRTANLRVNRPPVANADWYTVPMDTSLTVPVPGVLGNDTDPDGDMLTVGAHQAPVHGTLVLDSATGAFEYRGAPGFAGNDTFRYRAFDTHDYSLYTTVTVHVESTPTAVAHTYTLQQDTTLTVAAPGLLAGAGDADGDTVTVSAAGAAGHGALVARPDGTFTYRPSPGFVGTDTVVYTVTDGALISPPAVATFVVKPSASFAPTAVDHAYTIAENATFTASAPGLLAGALDPMARPLTVKSAGTPAHGRLVTRPDGSFAYRPASGYLGTDRFTYRVTNGTHDSGPATVTITVAHSALVTRVAGLDRYDVAVALAKKAFPGWRVDGGVGATVTTVIIACGSDAKAADPLGAAGLVGAAKAPLLLVRKDTAEIVPQATIDALKSIAAARRGVKPRIIVVGGPASVTPGHWSVLKRYASNPGGIIDRLTGIDRYEVAKNVALRIKAINGKAPAFVLLAAGNMPTRFYEPLALGAIAARNKVPVILVKGSFPTPAAVSALAAMGTATRYLGAHPSAVSTAAMAALRVPAANRIYGDADNRESFARAVAETATAKAWLHTANVGVTNKIADSLGGGAAMGLFDGPVLYTAFTGTLGGTSPLPPAMGFLADHASAVQTVYVVGGSGSVPEITMDRLRSIWP